MLISFNVKADSVEPISFDFRGHLASPLEWTNVNGLALPQTWSSFTSNVFYYSLSSDPTTMIPGVLGHTYSGQASEFMFFFQNSQSDNIIDKSIKSNLNDSSLSTDLILRFNDIDFISSSNVSNHQLYVGIYDLNQDYRVNLYDYNSFTGNNSNSNLQNSVATVHMRPFAGYNQSPNLTDIYQVVIRRRDNGSITGINNFTLNDVSLNGSVWSIDSDSFFTTIIEALNNLIDFLVSPFSRLFNGLLNSDIISSIDTIIGNVIIAIKDFFFNIMHIFTSAVVIINSIESPISDILKFSFLCLIGFTIWRLLK